MSWLADGLCFECTGCGACCRRPGLIEFQPDDVARIAAHQEMDQDRFRAKFEIDEAGLMEVTESRPCRFLDDNSCSIHSVRPAQCRAYPFWPEILRTKADWAAEAAHCEGINRGERWSTTEIEAARLVE